MKSRPPSAGHTPARLTDLPPSADPTGVGLPEMFRAAEQFTRPTHFPTVRSIGQVGKIHRSRRAPPLALRVAVVSLVVFVGGGVVGATIIHFVAPHRNAGVSVVSVPESKPEAHARRVRVNRHLANTTVPTSVPSPMSNSQFPAFADPSSATVAAQEPPVQFRAIANRIPRSLEASVHADPSADSKIVTQIQPGYAPVIVPEVKTPVASLVADALRLLESGQAEEALSRLDAYLHFERSEALAPEVLNARVEALLRMGRRQEASEALDHAVPAVFAAFPGLHVVRGELLVQQQQWREGIQAFDAATLASVPPSLQERALFGRAACHLRLGNKEAARRDLRAYVAQFPAGRHAADARESLGEN